MQSGPHVPHAQLAAVAGRQLGKLAVVWYCVYQLASCAAARRCVPAASAARHACSAARSTARASGRARAAQAAEARAAMAAAAAARRPCTELAGPQ